MRGGGSVAGHLRTDDQTLTAADERAESELAHFQLLYAELLTRQRRVLHEPNKHESLDEEQIRKRLTLLDLEELKLREKQRPPTRTFPTRWSCTPRG